jgi:hypothetical protein
MDSINPPLREITDPLLQRLYEYWNRTRGVRCMPSRAQVDPCDIRFVLGHVMLVDVVHGLATFRVRLQGTELGWWLGSDLTGKTLEELRSPDLRSLLGESFAQCVATRVPVFQRGRQYIDGLPRLYSKLVMPLSDDDRNVDKLLVALRCDEHG